MSLNINFDSVCDIAETVYFSVVDELSLNDECINVLIENTVFGQELYYMIENAIENFMIEKEMQGV